MGAGYPSDMSDGNCPSLVELGDLPGDETTRQFEGAERGGGVAISFYEERTDPGGGPDPHRHPYEEVFIVHAGEVEFEVAGETVGVKAGAVVVVPAETTHAFTNVGEDPLHMTCIHAAASMEQEDL